MTRNSSLKKYADGSLLRATNSEKVYLLENNKKRWITSIAAFMLGNYKWEDVKLVPPDDLRLIDEGENISAPALKPDGSLLKGSGPKVYLLENGKKKWITSAEVFVSRGYKWQDIILVSDAELAA